MYYADMGVANSKAKNYVTELLFIAGISNKYLLAIWAQLFKTNDVVSQYFVKISIANI